MEWSDVFWVILVILKEDVATVLLAAAGVSLEKALLIVLLGSSLGVTLFYHLREIILFLSRLGKVKKVWPRLLALDKQRHPPNQLANENDLTDYFFSLLKNKFQLLVERVRQHHVLPPLSIFAFACFPLPSLVWVAIVASWIIRQRYGFWIILAGTVIKTLILILAAYGFMGMVQSFFF